MSFVPIMTVRAVTNRIIVVKSSIPLREEGIVEDDKLQPTLAV